MSKNVKTETKRAWGSTHKDGSPKWADRKGSFRSYGMSSDVKPKIDELKSIKMREELRAELIADLMKDSEVSLEYVDGLPDQQGKGRPKDLVKINGSGKGISVDVIRQILDAADYLPGYLAEMDKQSADDES